MLIACTLLAGPGRSNAPRDDIHSFKVGLVLDKGGKDDKSFNSAAVEGIERARRELGIRAKFVEATDDNSFEPLLRAFASKGYDLIIAIGISQGEALRRAAPRFPGQRFAIVDAEVNAPNVRALLFQEHEGSYLVGALAAMSSRSGKIGYIGGMDIPLIRRFELGYEAGARAIDPKVRITSNFVGVTGDAWNNPAKAKELALAQYGSGVDVIFGAAGASGSGLFDAAEETGKLAIGVDSNQDWVKPGHVLTSMLKRVDVAVFETIRDALQGRFTAGTVRYGLANQGVDYSVDPYNEKLISPEERVRLEKLKADIVAGRIRVPDFYAKREGVK